MNFEKYVQDLGDVKDSTNIFGIPTGTKLDEMFHRVDMENGKFVRKPLGGIPSYSVINVTGVADTGKSLLAEQFALTQALRGYNVLFVTVESPVQFLHLSLKKKAELVGTEFDRIEKNISVIDVSNEFELRENLSTLLNTMDYAIRTRKTSITIIDSITGLYESKEMIARQIVRSIYNFLKSHRQTAMLISQKRSLQSSDTAEAAGGLAVAHIVDGTVVMSKKLIESKFDSSLYNMPIGSVLRTIRIDGCRMVPHDDNTYVFDINDAGFIEIKSKLHEFIRR